MANLKELNVIQYTCLFRKIESVIGREISEEDQKNIEKTIEKLGFDFIDLTNLVVEKTNELGLLIGTLMNAKQHNSSFWISYFKGTIYGFNKYYNKNGFLQKFPNFSFEFEAKEII